MSNISKERRIGILLVALGTPYAATEDAIRVFLREFLSDRMVVDLPRILWLPILFGIVLRVRPKKLVNRYKSLENASGKQPLEVELIRLIDSLRKRWKKPLGWLIGGAFRYAAGRRPRNLARQSRINRSYGSIADGLDELIHEGAERILVIPLFPQHSATTTGSIEKEVTSYKKKSCLPRVALLTPDLRVVREYHTRSAWIEAIAVRIKEAISRQRPDGRLLSEDQVVFSFHGIPTRYVRRGDRYDKACEASAAAIAKEVGLEQNQGDQQGNHLGNQWSLCYQSRFGPERWLGPNAEEHVVDLARAGIGNLFVVSPGFFSECIETACELGEELREVFMQAGGSTFHYISCLNGDEDGVMVIDNVACLELEEWKS